MSLVGIQQPIEGRARRDFQFMGCPCICSYCCFSHTLVIISYEFNQNPLGTFFGRLILKLLALLTIASLVYTWKYLAQIKNFRVIEKETFFTSTLLTLNSSFVIFSYSFFIVLFLYQDFLLQYFSFFIRCHILEWFIPLWLLL